MKAANPGRRRVTIEVDGTIFAIRGYQAHGYALAAGLRPTYNGVRGAWVADTRRLPDLIAHLEYRNAAYTVVDLATEAGASVAPTAPDGSVESDQDLPLFGPGGGDAA